MIANPFLAEDSSVWRSPFLLARVCSSDFLLTSSADELVSHIEIPNIAGAHELAAWFGRWPSFHDAEVLELLLRREGASSLRVLVWRTTSEIDSDGFYKTDHHAVVTFTFDDVADLEFADFSRQNVIAGLTCDPTENGIRVRILPTYGIGGYIDAQRVTISFEPTNSQATSIAMRRRSP